MEKEIKGKIEKETEEIKNQFEKSFANIWNSVF